ncbi:MAG: methyltransferase domain-containing protein [Rhodanobacteraceae bacterium]|nr:MAG: methyltransferase domain-containing protein [Rhodanobacteraceae bacterium]
MNDRPSTQAPARVNDKACPVCEAGASRFHARIDGYDYFQCVECDSLFIDWATLDRIDAGESTRIYDESYWNAELHSARERADGVSLARAGEAILYTRRPVERFLDVGTGPGYLLDALARHFPAHPDMFHGVELFPPDEHSNHPNYRVGDVGDLQDRFDAGACIEVVEHLTPKMLGRVARGLAAISNPGTLWLFNTGMPEYVLEEDPGYLDPLRRGHIVSYGLRGVAHLFEPHGFRVSGIPGKSYAWFAEFKPVESPGFDERVYRPLPGNRRLLEEFGLLFQAAFESARASLYMQTAWAQSRHGPTDGASVATCTTLDVWDEYQRMLHSRSWRLTKPLRAAARWSRAVRDRSRRGA